MPVRSPLVISSTPPRLHVAGLVSVLESTSQKAHVECRVGYTLDCHNDACVVHKMPPQLGIYELHFCIPQLQ